ncbi:MAG: aminoacyl-tRNA hydrolase [Holosporaceae bacterium]|nr:aminoacyl-tRNA hydrolase [Holosporaceae bacterium]
MFVGLGNPGLGYRNNRHNVGFVAIDTIAGSTEFKKIASLAGIVVVSLSNQKILMAKPMTFMNLSGQAVRFLSDFYKIPLEKIYVFHDDIDLSFGHIKIKKGGGSAGHNGLKSLDSTMGNNYWRVRIGIGRPERKSEVASYVLSDFSEDEKNTLENIFFKMRSNISLLIEEPDRFGSLLNMKEQ